MRRDLLLTFPGSLAGSPDGRYVAEWQNVGEAEIVHLRVFKISRSGRKQARKQAHKQRRTQARKQALFVRDINSFLWRPRRSHTLLFGSSDVYGGAGILGSWNGRRIHRLVHWKRGIVNDYCVCAITKNGKVLYYERNNKRHRLRLK